MSIINFYSYKGGVGCEGSPIGAVLEWIPRARPRGAIVVSTSTSVVSAELRKLGFRAFSAGLLEGKTLEAIIRLSFIRFGKPLGSDASEGIVKTMPERTAAYARTFVELLRQYGLFEDLNSEIKRRLRRRRHPRPQANDAALALAKQAAERRCSKKIAPSRGNPGDHGCSEIR